MNSTLSQYNQGKVGPVPLGVWGSGGITPPFLTLTLDGGEWSAKSPRYQFYRGLGGLHRALYGHYGDERNLYPCQELNLGRSTDWTIRYVRDWFYESTFPYTENRPRVKVTAIQSGSVVWGTCIESHSDMLIVRVISCVLLCRWALPPDSWAYTS
jgi:hypothetical protein